MTFSDKTQFPKLQILEDNYETILKEYRALGGLKMRTWPEKHKFLGSWTVFGFYHCGRKLETLCDLCPETTRIIESMGTVYMAGFSRMAPKTQILAHVDDVPKGLTRIHFGVSVPDTIRCGFYSDSENIRWKNGKAFAFDPTKEHKAWNMSDEERIILLLDFEKF